MLTQNMLVPFAIAEIDDLLDDLSNEAVCPFERLDDLLDEIAPDDDADMDDHDGSVEITLPMIQFALDHGIGKLYEVIPMPDGGFEYVEVPA